MKWLLVTGAPCADIGKGSLCAAIARILRRNGHDTAYQKLEPCLQRSLADVPNGAIGEIVRLDDGRRVDFDVARVLFYAPGTALGTSPDLSLWHCLQANKNGNAAPSPRIAAETAAGIAQCIPMENDFLVVEIGGTLGEQEHRILLDGLVRALGQPTQHLVVGAILCNPSGRKTTKPLQISLDMSPIPPDVVFLRGGGNAELDALNAYGRCCRFVRVGESVNPVNAYMDALDVAAIPHLRKDANDPQRQRHNRRGVVGIYGDVMESRRYESLALRIDCWSGGRIKMVNGNDAEENLCGVVVARQTKFHCPLPMLHISADTVKNRPDWAGTADAPRGDVFDFLLAAESSLGESPKSSYIADEFAKEYIARSQEGALRDHGIMDKIVWGCLPEGDSLRAARILDIGCGYGRWVPRLIEKGAAEIVGVEPSHKMREVIEKQKFSRFRLLATSIENAPLEGFFDAALALMSLDHVVDLPRTANLISSHLKPGGRLIITTEHPWRTSTGINRWRTHPEDNSRRQAIVDGYHNEGPRVFRWFGRPEPVVVQHRTIETWIRVLRDADFNILSVHEPVSPAPKDGGVPRFWLLCAEKKGAQERT